MKKKGRHLSHLVGLRLQMEQPFTLQELESLAGSGDHRLLLNSMEVVSRQHSSPAGSAVLAACFPAEARRASGTPAARATCRAVGAHAISATPLAVNVEREGGGVY